MSEQTGKIGWVEITVDDADGRFSVIEDPSAATAALCRP
jgi:hypothetical protein